MIRDDDKFYAAVTQNGTWAEGRGVQMREQGSLWKVLLNLHESDEPPPSYSYVITQDALQKLFLVKSLESDALYHPLRDLGSTVAN